MDIHWKDQAKALRIGSSRKIQCCGSSPSAIINNNDRGVSLYCFRCGAKEWEPHGQRSLAEIMATRRVMDGLDKTAEMPDDAVALMDGPSAALFWVLAGGLQPEIANDSYGFRWHEATRRVMVPLNGGLLSRAVFGERPKYRMFGSGRLYELPLGTHKATVVVEDVLSSIAVNRVGWPSVAILGTSISPHQAKQLTKQPAVIGWFDGDKAGDAAWVRLRQRMALYPVELKRVRTERDPKNLHRADIIRELERTA